MADEDYEFLYYEDPDFELDDSLEHVDDEPDDCSGDISDTDDSDDPHDPIQLAVTRQMKARLAGTDILAKVLTVLDCMSSQGLALPHFLDSLSWGNAACHANAKVRYHRTALMVSDELPQILERWHRPPRRSGSRQGARPAGARLVLEKFANSCVSSCIEREIKLSAPLFLSPPKELSEEHLTSFDFNEFKSRVKRRNPTLWSLLRHSAYSALQESRNKEKDPEMVILNIISQIQYTRSHRRARISKLWAIYLKACGLSARAFDALHLLGITMSHKWTANAYGQLSDSAMQDVRARIQKSPFSISHDNADFPLRVFSQRLHNQSHFVSGVAGTIWILPARAALSLQANRLLQVHRALACSEMFDFADVLYGDPAADARMEAQNTHFVLRLLLDSPEFADYPGHGTAALDPPPPVHKLQTGPENATHDFILGTESFEVASYDGVVRAMHQFFRQLHLDTEDEQRKTALERVIPWLGDQLTVERLRGLWKYRHEDYNSFDRLDYMMKPMLLWIQGIVDLSERFI
ncbi:hypothetical protein C8J57DRAFT_1719626 [Mycena rebaudengoi]|nr:hypothetical protein C8J57DRAFT_1719626 [Mycena rebaudengoi]